MLSLSREIRTILDEAGRPAIRIMASGDLNEYKIAELEAAGAPIETTAATAVAASRMRE